MNDEFETFELNEDLKPTISGTGVFSFRKKSSPLSERVSMIEYIALYLTSY